ncbi:MAG TPA: hypothetical protein VJN18_11015 [Polyangiaceae bacterium]|nr:hypothetical protein [Polyangiaceae bacterium]
MSRADTLEALLSSTVKFAELAEREPKTLEGVIQNLRRPTGAQEVDQMHAALVDLLTGVRSVLGEEATC